MSQARTDVEDQSPRGGFDFLGALELELAHARDNGANEVNVEN